MTMPAPLVAGGVRCHGGFDDDGTYVSPRTRHRRPAIDAWEEKRVEDFGTPRLDIPLDSWPESFPNVAQTKLLLRQGVTEPTVAALTRIGTVEGFGGMLRLLPIPDFGACFEEEITGTAIAHIGGGLFEAHARDEAGHGEEAGHNIMWFAARDIAFDHPVTEDATAAMLARMGIGTGPRTAADMARHAPGGRGGPGPARRHRLHPRDARGPHDRPAPHRDLGLPRVRLGRGRAVATPTWWRGRERRPAWWPTSARTRPRTSTGCAPLCRRCVTAPGSGQRAGATTAPT